jgi:uncharacterized protein (DUF736 family)
MENKLNKGAIFKNANKKEDKHPDYKGIVNVDGKEKAISLWLNTSKDGVKYFSVGISEPYVKESKTEEPPF